MDRNKAATILRRHSWVALRKESVDRNKNRLTGTLMAVAVALRKESVDRNDKRQAGWAMVIVALRKESVDRNAD